jgi:hypothetical protein
MQKYRSEAEITAIAVVGFGALCVLAWLLGVIGVVIGIAIIVLLLGVK